ncbi:MAG: cora-like Mg2+ transporter protein-domain-containing protein [Lentinula lateritia]|nr:MAG: cora-like Mg2+ transporter protein-domain-containing protein [Lentinula lateritia]
MPSSRYATTESRYTRPPPPHRHAGPSAPWPWIDIHDEVDANQLESPLPPIPPLCDHNDCGGCWKGYPQSRFPNWTPGQVLRSGIAEAVHDYDTTDPCIIHYVNVDTGGFFTDADKHFVREGDVDVFWNEIAHETRPSNLRVRALFIQNLSGPVLQMLGAKYNIEPFFFSSSLSSIPSRFQEEVRPGKGDHITITLSFIRTVRATSSKPLFPSNHNLSSTSSTEYDMKDNDPPLEQMINTQAPLRIGQGEDMHMLALDLLSVHLIRRNDGLGSTIISYHGHDGNATSAPYLHERIRFAGQSVYWQSIFQKSPDPTFVLLTFIWHAMYAWDEALEKLYGHICWMESQIMRSSDMDLTRDLHTIQAHLLHYSSLLEDFRKSVVFVNDTLNPAMDSLPNDERLLSRKLLEKECNNLLIEVERLEKSRTMQERRLKNVMNLVFSTVNILDSKRMQDLTEAAVRDSAAMKQIAYLSMIFLPASFVAGVFGMNVKELSAQTLGTLPHYFAAAFPLTAVTVWIVIAFQSKHLFKNRETSSFWARLAWPILMFQSLFSKSKKTRTSLSSVNVLNQWNTNQQRRRRSTAAAGAIYELP